MWRTRRHRDNSISSARMELNKRAMTKTTLLLLLTFGFIFPAIAQQGEMKIVPTADQETYKLYYSCDVISDITIKIKDENKESVYSRKIKDKKGFILPIDFGEFGTGQYLVEVFTPLFTLTDTVKYMDFAERTKALFEWEILADKERVIVTALKPLDDKITVIINDNNGGELDKQVMEGNKFGMRVFDFNGTDARAIDVNIYYKGIFIDSRLLDLR